MKYRGNDKKRHDRDLRRAFGITVKQYEALEREQDEVCWICEREDCKKENLSVDHDHNTGKVRGLLCRDCNRALGQFKDDINLVKRAVEYLEKGPAELIEYDEYIGTPHKDRARWRCLVESPMRGFDSLQEAGEFYGVHACTIRDWTGMNTNKPHLKKDGWKSTKVFK